MKFRCRMVNVVAMRDFTNIINAISRMSKQCVLKITQENLSFKVGDDRIPTVWVEMCQKEFFSEYVMEGVNSEQNEIYLQFDSNMYARCLGSLRMTAKSVKMKLTNKISPCLTIEIELPSLAIESRQCMHDVPVRVIPRKEWPEHQVPDLPEFDISVEMPQLKCMRNVVERMKNMSSRLIVSADQFGEFVLKIDTDSATVSTHFQDLQVQSSSQGKSDGKVSATVDIKKFLMFLGWDFLHSGNAKCNILEERIVNLSLELENRVKVHNFIPAMAT